MLKPQELLTPNRSHKSSAANLRTHQLSPVLDFHLHGKVSSQLYGDLTTGSSSQPRGSIKPTNLLHRQRSTEQFAEDQKYP